MIILAIIFVAIIASLFITGIVFFLMHTHEHMKYLDKQEAYWIEVKREREEKEKQVKS